MRNILYKYGDLAPFALYHLHISHFFGDQRKFAQKTTSGGGGIWGRPAVFFISTNFDPQKNWEIFGIWFFYCKFDYGFLKFSNFSTSQN